MRAMLIIPAVLFAQSAGAAPGDLPRDAQIEVDTQQSLSDVQACFSRTLAKRGKVLAVPIEGGAAIDWGPYQPEGLITFEIREAGDHRHISVRYRHPFSADGANKFFGDLIKRCPLN